EAACDNLKPFEQFIRHPVMEKIKGGKILCRPVTTQPPDLAIENFGWCCGDGHARLVQDRRTVNKRGMASFPTPLRQMIDFALPPRCPGCGAVVDDDHRFCAACWLGI